MIMMLSLLWEYGDTDKVWMDDSVNCPRVSCNRALAIRAKYNLKTRKKHEFVVSSDPTCIVTKYYC